ncbi:pyruvate formate-lyase-activating protein [Acetobacteroides hydrogenigenes]|uniref:Pyruvate formate-lyase-activating enzyme n=1 Tax=Acetobacteroides hydrogenigenes TaxID=979970 RepID=A0A4R2ESG1_9BACT|nr:pyruvate formate-lyase-activating protein [Acetobacteroides hydrogenigenes]TCN72178.1 pyruvate formate lyase activating enzyme [Acetobacteroides hydrogenigenes]
MLNVHSYESMGTFDGPGLRLVVFLQGCNFNCLYCANPDTITLKGGTPTEIEEIVRMAVSQKSFFGKKGGVTISGGEPTLQAKALIPLFKKLKEENINICIDSNGSVFNNDVAELLKYVDLVLLDVKHFNDEWHRKITNHENNRTLKMAQYLRDNGIKMWLRYVLVPGYSDQEEHIKALGEHFKDFTNVERLEILPYHTLGKHKYEHLNMKYQLDGVPENTPEQLKRAKSILEPYFKLVVVN